MNSSKTVFIPVLVCLLFTAACSDKEQEPGAGPGLADEQADFRESARELRQLQYLADLAGDVDDIRKLQRIYGYYVDQADWDNVVALFTEDATAEYGMSGVYAGKDSIRNFLYALSGGRPGLQDGQLSEHMQLQSVVNVAADGLTAWGRWRNFGMIGRYGESAEWEEGPYENRYRKENGIWKIQSIHWYETYTAAYSTGWARPAENDDQPPSSLPPPDRPPTEVYQSWPGAYLPPYHWQSPDVQAAVGAEVSLDDDNSRPGAAELSGGIKTLEQQVRQMEDLDAIERLQRTYGFYMDMALWSQAADLFADSGTMEIGRDGVYAGRQKILEYLNSQGAEFPQWGRLIDRMQLQPVVHVAADGLSAKGRWRMFSQTGEWHKDQYWGLGTYENEYVKQDGVWKISSLHLFDRMYTPYAEGWARVALPTLRTQTVPQPDRPASVDYEPYPAVYIPPYHYSNPVTAAAPSVPGGGAGTGSQLTREEMQTRLADLRRRINLLRDVDEIENLHSTYGYYLDKNQWDALAGIFAEDGTIEIAQRGVYAGRQSIRNNLNLYGEQGVHDGNLHNHMQFQPVIHVAADGMTARVRSRAFSQLGTYGRYGTWMGGVYENTLVKVDGIWKIKSDQVFNTYFAGYEQGWSMGEPRHPPGITASNPPDAPPSVVFDLFPDITYPPFHYNNPVTGEPVVLPVK